MYLRVRMPKCTGAAISTKLTYLVYSVPVLLERSVCVCVQKVSNVYLIVLNVY